MHRHLVSVEVRVVSGANERMNANGFALNQLGFKSLNRQSMQSGRSIQQHRMTLGYFLENVPDLRRLALNHLLCATHGVDVTKRSEEHTSELQSQSNLVCRLLLEKKKKMEMESRLGKERRVYREKRC